MRPARRGCHDCRLRRWLTAQAGCRRGGSLADPVCKRQHCRRRLLAGDGSRPAPVSLLGLPAQRRSVFVGCRTRAAPDAPTWDGVAQQQGARLPPERRHCLPTARSPQCGVPAWLHCCSQCVGHIEQAPLAPVACLRPRACSAVIGSRHRACGDAGSSGSGGGGGCSRCTECRPWGQVCVDWLPCAVWSRAARRVWLRLIKARGCSRRHSVGT